MHTIQTAGCVLLRWGHGNVTLTGWGLFVVLLTLLVFGEFVRDVLKLWKKG